LTTFIESVADTKNIVIWLKNGLYLDSIWGKSVSVETKW
jgi:hypothetical protein